MTNALPIIKPGQRVLIAGSTGCGKSTLARWLLLRTKIHWVILNPKHTASYYSLENSNVVKSLNFEKIEKSLGRFQFTIVNPESDESDPDNMDAMIMKLHLSWQNVGLVCDELYTLHKNGVAGKGLLGWLTRGRELKQSFLGLTQRPAWLSQFLFSETDYLCAMRLGLTKDRKRMIEMSDCAMLGEKIPNRQWLWFPVISEKLVRYGPVPL